MDLFIKDRLLIPGLLPKEGNYHQFHLKKSILRKIEISEAEKNELGIQEEPETKRIVWDSEKDTALSVEFTAEELGYLKGACEGVSDQALPDEMWLTVEKIYDAI